MEDGAPRIWSLEWTQGIEWLSLVGRCPCKHRNRMFASPAGGAGRSSTLDAHVLIFFLSSLYRRNMWLSSGKSLSCPSSTCSRRTGNQRRCPLPAARSGHAGLTLQNFILPTNARQWPRAVLDEAVGASAWFSGGGGRVRAAEDLALLQRCATSAPSPQLPAQLTETLSSRATRGSSRSFASTQALRGSAPCFRWGEGGGC